MKNINPLKTAGKRAPSRKNIKLPTEYDLLTLPTLAPITILKTALYTTITAIHCEHLDLDELPRYFEDKASPPSSLVLAQYICDAANDLLLTIEEYREAYLDDIEAMKRAADFPF
jgi:hypothetical protein